MGDCQRPSSQIRSEVHIPLEPQDLPGVGMFYIRSMHRAGIFLLVRSGPACKPGKDPSTEHGTVGWRGVGPAGAVGACVVGKVGSETSGKSEYKVIRMKNQSNKDWKSTETKRCERFI